MYLSRIEINIRRRESVKLLSSPQIVHAAMMASFPSNEDSGRVLWRIDRLGPSTYIILQSDIKPDFSHVVDQFGWPASEQKWDSIEYDSFLEKIENDQVWRFRLTANPVHSINISSQKQDRGKVVAHVTADQQKKWLIDRSSKYGFTIADVSTDIKEPALEIRSSGSKQFPHDGQRVSFNAVTFEGIIKVENADLLRDALKKGIGRAKGYGCGLMTIARI
jgi:CRISPR system Cascade subunit CasE